MGGFEKLELSTETIRELTAEELGEVAGGASPDTVICLTGMYPSINTPCDTLVCMDGRR